MEAAPEPARTDGVAISELMVLPDAGARRQRLLDAVLAEAGLPAQSAHLEVNSLNRDLQDYRMCMISQCAVKIPSGTTDR
jgi:hypothetical protein